MNKNGGVRPKNTKKLIMEKQQVVVVKQQPKKKNNKNKRINRENGLAMVSYNSAPNNFATTSKVMVPSFRSSKQRSIIVRHSEFIQSLTGPSSNPGNFTIIGTFPLNPGVVGTFPWLSSIALSFEYYQFRKVNFRYVSQISSSSNGIISIIPDYDAGDPAPVNENVAMSFTDTVQGNIWNGLVCSLKSNSMNTFTKRRVVRGVNSIGNQSDIKTYDAGNVFVASSGIGGNNFTMGKLWVDYEVELFIPGSASNLSVPAFTTPNLNASLANPFGTPVNNAYPGNPSGLQPVTTIPSTVATTANPCNLAIPVQAGQEVIADFLFTGTSLSGCTVSADGVTGQNKGTISYVNSGGTALSVFNTFVALITGYMILTFTPSGSPTIASNLMSLQVVPSSFSR